MTKTNLFRATLGILLACALVFGGSSSAYAKSYSNIAQTSVVVHIVPPADNYTAVYAAAKETKPTTVVNKWMDSGSIKVWKGVPRWMRDLGLCIRKHESIEQGHYKAHNGRSSASGAYQFLDGTWQGNAKWTRVDGKFVARKYAAANHAPAWVQDAVFIHSIRHGGILNWVGTHCGYGT